MRKILTPGETFHSIAISGPGRLRITQGPRPSVVVRTDRRLLPGVTAAVADGVLSIGFTAPAVVPMRRWEEVLRYDVTVNELRSLTLRGAPSVEIPDLDVDELAIEVDGPARVRIAQLTADRLVCTMRDAREVRIAGDVETQTVTMKGASTYQAEELVSDFLRLHMTGAGWADVCVHHELSVRVTGSGQVRYRGRPDVDPQIVGPGSIRRISARAAGNANREVPAR